MILSAVAADVVDNRMMLCLRTSPSELVRWQSWSGRWCHWRWHYRFRTFTRRHWASGLVEIPSFSGPRSRADQSLGARPPLLGNGQQNSPLLELRHHFLRSASAGARAGNPRPYCGSHRFSRRILLHLIDRHQALLGVLLFDELSPSAALKSRPVKTLRPVESEESSIEYFGPISWS